MGKATAFVNAWTAGEIGPDAWDRTDLQQHAKGCAEASNLIPLVTGPLRSRTGFLDRGTCIATATLSRIVPFIRSATDALFLEFGPEVARVWTVSGSLIMSGGAPYSFVTPWPAARLNALFFKQEGDGLIVTDRTGGRTYVVKRFADTDWTVTAFAFSEGPWLPENTSAGVTVTADVLSVPVRLDASAAVFVATDVGRLIRLRESDGNPGVTTWTSGTDYSTGARVQYDGRVYALSGAGGKSGTTPPLHQEGVVSDGRLSWQFLHDGQGQVLITAVLSNILAEGTLVRALPTTGATKYWAKQAYSEADGWPRALVESREERLVFGATLGRPGSVDMTRTSGWTLSGGDFKPGMGTGRVVDDDAVRLDLGGSSRVVWFVSGTALVAGCTDGEYVLSGSTLDDPITPAGRKARPISGYGSADVAPVKVLGPPPSILFVERNRRVLRELLLSADTTVESEDRSVLPHHIHDRGLAELAWAGASKLLWCRLDDGGLAAMAYYREQGVFAATRQPLPAGWTVESIATAPTPEGGDALMMSVHRVKGGVDQRRVWLLAPRSIGCFIDGAYIYAGAPATTLTGLGIYEGETVAVVADGARVPDLVVTSGAITLPAAASTVIAGPKMLRRFECLPMDMEGVGSTNGRMIKPTHATVLVSCVEVDVGTDQPDSFERVKTRAPGEQNALAVKKTKKRVALGGGADRDVRLVIATDAPFDLTIHAYRLEGEVTP